MATDERTPSIIGKYGHWMLLLAGLVIAFGFGEFALRVALRPDVSIGQRLRLYGYLGNQSSDDVSYRFVLRYNLVGRDHEPMTAEFDSMLGWTGEVTDDNPLGTVTDQPYALDSLRAEKRVLFFGNSFVQGYTEMPNNLPQQLGRTLDGLSVLNFGVNGYGLDQMYLRARSVIDEFDEAHVIVGIFYDDIDRLVFPLRSRPKPYYEVTDSGVELRGVPIPASYKAWLEKFPPQKTSYLLSAMGGLVRRAFNSRWGVEHFFRFHHTEFAGKREDKQAITAALVKWMKQMTEQREMALTFVFFPHPAHLIHQGWYETFLTELFERENVDFVSMIPPLQAFMEEHDLVWWRDVYPLDSHPDSAQNAIMTEYLSRHLEARYGYERVPLQD